jgi:hypothetical protein
MSEVQESGKLDQITWAEFHATDWHTDSDTALTAQSESISLPKFARNLSLLQHTQLARISTILASILLQVGDI